MSDTDTTEVTEEAPATEAAGAPVVESEVETEVTPPAEGDSANELAELREAVLQLQARLDTVVLEAEQAKKDRDDLLAEIAANAAASEAAQELARVREERLTKVSAVASFPAEYMQANADRWAAMPEEAFTACLADWAAISQPTVTVDDIPRTTAMTASHETASSSESVSTMREVMGLTLRGVDPRTL